MLEPAVHQLSLFPPDVTLTDGRICGPLPANAPIVTALVGRDWYGNEHGRFYDYLPFLEGWLADVGFPPITYVWYEMQRRAKHFTYWSLAGNCLANRTLPSISFRRSHSCSLK